MWCFIIAATTAFGIGYFVSVRPPSYAKLIIPFSLQSLEKRGWMDDASTTNLDVVLVFRTGD